VKRMLAAKSSDMSTFFAFLHHVAAFTLAAALAVEFVLIRQEVTRPGAIRLLVTDAVLGTSAAALLVVGLLRVFYFEKGASYYFSSHAFLTKLSVFLVVAVLSAAPTIEFLSWRKAVKAGQAPSPAPAKLKLIRNIIHFELIGVVVILLCAAIMARGGWQ
jgi:putative membrane protein